jgi:hypothetical protein
VQEKLNSKARRWLKRHGSLEGYVSSTDKWKQRHDKRMMVRLLKLRSRLVLGEAPVIEGTMQAHLYPLKSMAMPRERGEYEQASGETLIRNAIHRSHKSTSQYMTLCEVTSLLIASKSRDILRRK